MQWTYTIKADCGDPILHDIDCELDVRAALSAGEPRVFIEGVTVLGVDLWKDPDPFSRALAAKLTSLAERDEELAEILIDRAMTNGDISFSGFNGNDPGGRWSRPKAAE